MANEHGAASAALPIETPSLVLRHFTMRDTAAVLALSREEAARNWLPSQVYEDHAHAASVLEYLIGQYASPGDPRRGPYVLAIELRATGALIGHVGLSLLDGEVEIGFGIGEQYQRRGFAAEAIGATCEWASRAFGLNRILAVTAARNTASKRSLERAGFAFERDEVMDFQGVEQPVCAYRWSVEP